VERRLGELIGKVAGKLHTGRSRNDQVALDLRLYLKQAGEAQVVRLHRFASTLADLADAEAETVVSSYTHLQQAQPTTLGHHLLAHAWAALRDAGRFSDAGARLAVSPLGAGASAGSSLPLDPVAVADRLGLAAVMPNALDAVAARDFVAEYVFCCAQAMVGLSRLAEEIVLWSTREFGWVSLSDEVSTGSSALPQKRNPDVAELVRGRAAGVVGDAAAILTLQKALPLTYNRDLQEDKRIVFHADDTLAGSVEAMIELLGGVTFRPPPPAAETVALDLAEALVSRGVPFREAHRKVGELVARLEAEGRSLAEATLDDLRSVASEFDEEDLSRLDPVTSVRARVTPGSGGPESVRSQVAEIRRLVVE
jgi:argininosuccinate lyase